MFSCHKKPRTYGHRTLRLRTAALQGSLDVQTGSLSEIPGPESNTTRPEPGGRMAKRSRHSSLQSAVGLKSHTGKENFEARGFGINAEAGMDPSNTNTQPFQTPHPSQLTEAQVFKLGSSKPAPDSPGHESDPVPAVRSTNRFLMPVRPKITSSRSLKENMAPLAGRNRPRQAPGSAHTPILKEHICIDAETKRSHRRILASPFTSRPSSPSSHASSAIAVEEMPRDRVTKPKTSSDNEGHARTRPDAHINAGIPPILKRSNTTINAFISNGSPLIPGTRRINASQSAQTSPTHRSANITAVSFAEQRRPSLPAARRSLTLFGPLLLSSHTNSFRDRDSTGALGLHPQSGGDPLVPGPGPYLDSFSADSRVYFTSSLGGSVDFNRPPSQLSLYAVEVDSDDYETRDIFVHIRGRSTPNRARELLPPSIASLVTPADYSKQIQVDNNRNVEDYLRTTETREYSPWISDSIVSPPSYHERQKQGAQNVPADVSLEDKDITLEMAHQNSSHAVHGYSNSPAPLEPVLDAPGRYKDGRQKPTLPRLKTSGLPPTWTRDVGNNAEATENTNTEPQEETGCDMAPGPAFKAPRVGARARSGTIIQTHSTTGARAGGRNRSGTIVQGGGGARRTRSGTVVQASQAERLGPPLIPTDIQEDAQTQGYASGACSCCSSDDELMLRSHSHLDLDSGDLEWYVAEPPSPGTQGLRKGNRHNGVRGRRKKNRGKDRRSEYRTGGIVEDDWEKGMDGDIEDDELDLLGTFVPEEW